MEESNPSSKLLERVLLCSLNCSAQTPFVSLWLYYSAEQQEELLLN